METNKTVYLGDGLYAQFDGYQVEVYSSNGIHKTIVVFMDRNTLANFLRLTKA
jgi:hypothetical protein